ncbi:hypothetical protein Slin14017_G126250 [Septoria linicola]|nr:hypothetical protein Slin14017_G126250 [Septoria linicola]
MDSGERARMLKHLKVRFGDVQSDHHVGRLAIASCDAKGTQQATTMRKGRLYI